MFEPAVYCPGYILITMTIKTKSYGFVALQFTLLAGITLLPGKPTADWLQFVSLALVSIGFIVCFVAIGQLRKFSLTALPVPVKDAKLLESGLYAFARHPIYTGLLMAMTGVVISRFSILRLVLLVSLYVVLYEKSKFEEDRLLHTFGSKYKKYQARTRRFM